MGYAKKRTGRNGKPRFTAVYIDLRGSERSAGTFSSEKAANQAWQKAEVEQRQGRVGDPARGRQTLRKYVERWLPNHVIKPTTREKYAYYLSAHILPVLGGLRMTDIFPEHIREWIAWMQREGRSAWTIQYCKSSILNSILTTALNDQVTYIHPCRGVKTPTVPATPRVIITPEQFDAIYAALPGADAQLLVETAIETGLRWGELTELRPGDLDLSSGMLTVSRKVIELNREFHPDGQRFLVKQYPKDKEYRRLKLRPQIAAKLKAHSDRSIKLHLANTAHELMEDLQSIEEVCARPDPLPGLGFIAQVRPLSPKSELAKTLDERLDTEIGRPEPGRIALAVPGECRDEFEFAESFKVTLAGSSEMYDEMDASQLVAAVRNKPAGDRLPALRAGRVEMFADTDGAQLLSRKIPADQWLTAEVSEGIVHYFYWQGQWYEIGAEYLATVESRIAELLARPASVTLPPWKKPAGGNEDHDEDWYNKEVAKQDGYVLLDRDTVRTRRLRGGGLEIADALGPSGQFVCVKKADSTAPLNHLFAQGRVAIETLRYDREAREKFLAKLQQLAPEHSLDTSFSPPVLVLGIMLKDGIPLTGNSLFAFAKISLLHTATMMEGMGARLEIVSISRTQPSGSDAAVPVARVS